MYPNVGCWYLLSHWLTLCRGYEISFSEVGKKLAGELAAAGSVFIYVGSTRHDGSC